MGKIKTVISFEYQMNPKVQEFVEHLPVIFEKEGEILYNKRNLIKRFRIDPSDEILNSIVVKRYKRPNLIQKITYTYFRSSKAKRAFYNAAELRKRGVSTPQEIAYIEQNENGFLKYGYYISGSDDAPAIRERLIELKDFDKLMAADFAVFAAILHEKGILHHDLNSTNVLYHANNGHYSFSVIDINRMKFYPEGQMPSREDCFENLTRFTGRMDLYEYVLKCYLEKRAWYTEATMQEAIETKVRHDEQWKRRKSFLKRFSYKKK